MRYFIIGLICFVIGGLSAAGGVYLYSKNGLESIKEESNRAKERIANANERVSELKDINSELINENENLRRVISELTGEIESIRIAVDGNIDKAGRIIEISDEIGDIINKY